jgi:hypothetical protein
VFEDGLRGSDLALDIDGRLDDPDYINRLPPAERETAPHMRGNLRR